MTPDLAELVVAGCVVAYLVLTFWRLMLGLVVFACVALMATGMVTVASAMHH